MEVRDMCGEVRMEEGFMRTVIEYGSIQSKEIIQEAISKIENEQKVFPTVIRKAISPIAGNISIEFEIGGCDREAGNFSEALLKKLNIQACDLK
ncbi:MAG: hypothetical protein ISR68_03335 [Campylobacterales bacterium]|nr:hypothetical protein [Campylobacterales bacterium]